MVLINLDTARITDWESFHEAFADAFGFPDFYGRNMNAWVDCMACLDDPESRMTSVHTQASEILVLQLEHASDLRQRFREAYDAIVECSAFVNFRRIDVGLAPLLALSFYK